MNVLKIANALIDKFEENDFKPISLTMKLNGDIVIVKGWTGSSEPATNVQDFEMFEVSCLQRTAMHPLYDTIEEVAEALGNYQELVNRTEASEKALKDFFERNVKPFSKDDIETGARIYKEGLALRGDIQAKEPCLPDEIIEELMLQRAAARLGIDEKHAELCALGYNNWSFYSDWYKDIYGHRP